MIENLEKLKEQADLEALDIFEAHPDFPKSVPFGYYHENRDRIFAELLLVEALEIVYDEIQYELSEEKADEIILKVRKHFT